MKKTEEWHERVLQEADYAWVFRCSTCLSYTLGPGRYLPQKPSELTSSKRLLFVTRGGLDLAEPSMQGMDEKRASPEAGPYS